MHAKVSDIKFDCVLIASIFHASAIFFGGHFFFAQNAFYCHHFANSNWKCIAQLYGAIASHFAAMYNISFSCSFGIV